MRRIRFVRPSVQERRACRLLAGDGEYALDYLHVSDCLTFAQCLHCKLHYEYPEQEGPSPERLETIRMLREWENGDGRGRGRGRGRARAARRPAAGRMAARGARGGQHNPGGHMSHTPATVSGTTRNMRRMLNTDKWASVQEHDGHSDSDVHTPTNVSSCWSDQHGPELTV